jgi:hypothetical protein
LGAVVGQVAAGNCVGDIGIQLVQRCERVPPNVIGQPQDFTADHIALESACCVVAYFLALLAAARQQQGARHDHRQQDGMHLTAGFLQKAWHNVLAGAVRRERG